MKIWTVEFLWPDYQRYSGKETAAKDEEQAVKNILFQVFKARKPALDIILLWQKMVEDGGAYLAYDITEHRKGQ